MKQLTIFVFMVISGSLFSCNKDVLRGNGSNITQTRTLAPFTAVETHYGIKAEISYGPAQQLAVSGYENLINELETSVENEILKLNYRRENVHVRNENVVAHIQIPVLQKATIHGSSDIVVSNFANGNEFTGSIHGSGSIRVTGSTYQKASLGINGSGNIQAKELQAVQVAADIHGSGDIRVSVGGKLTAAIFGSGNIYYWGNPAVETQVHGSGKVVRK